MGCLKEECLAIQVFVPNGDDFEIHYITSVKVDDGRLVVTKLDLSGGLILEHCFAAGAWTQYRLYSRE
jgi:hypothetical protein